MYSIQFMEDIEKENYSNSGQVSPILMNLSGVAQKNFSYYNKDNIDLNRFFEKMTFQDLYNDFAEENTPTHSSSSILQSSSSSMNQHSSNQISNSCSITPTHVNSQNQMPLQEYSNNYQNMNYRHKVSLQSQSSFCSQASTASSSMSFSNATQFSANPFSNITNIKNNNNTVIITQGNGNTPSHFNTAHSQHQQHLQQISYHKQASIKMEKKSSKTVKLKNAIDEFFSRPLDNKFQQKITFQNTCSYTPTLSINPISSYSDQGNTNNNTYDLFSNSTSNSCYSLFMSQQNSQTLSECDTNSEFSVY